MVKLGDEVQDTITGFEGIVTGIATYLTGCNQASVTSSKLEGGKVVAEWFDVQRLRVLITGKVRLDNGVTPGGPQNHPLKH